MRTWKLVGLTVLAVLVANCDDQLPVPTTVTVTPSSAELNSLGETVQLMAGVYDQYDQVMPDQTVTWTSASNAIATVDTEGLVTATGNGNTPITASSGPASGSASVTVMQTVASVHVSPDSIVLEIEGMARLEATATDMQGNDVPDVAFEWVSSDPNVATVDESGLVFGIGGGTTYVVVAAGDARDTAYVRVLSGSLNDHKYAINEGLPERPFVRTTIGGSADGNHTTGTLALSLDPDVFPALIIQDNISTEALVAGSKIGDGRVVALPGQDFISSGDRATLLGNDNVVQLLVNAVRWAGASRESSIKVLVDNQSIANVLEDGGFDNVEVVGSAGPWSIRDWGDNALSDVDVAVVQTNEWGSVHLVEEFVEPLRRFAEDGGGLVVAASAMHWSWWIEGSHGPLTANLIFRDTGISWKINGIPSIESATNDFDADEISPNAIWNAYLHGDRLSPSELMLLPPLFNGALEQGRTIELDIALTRMTQEAPELPVVSMSPEARFVAETGHLLGPYDWPNVHPWSSVFPGSLGAGAEEVDVTVNVDATWKGFPSDGSRYVRHIALGYYAPPSEIVTIEIPANHANGGIYVAIGEMYDRLDWAGATHWFRAPSMRRVFPLTSTRTEITNAYGGSITLIVPPTHTGIIPVTINGVIQMAVYTYGETTAAEWQSDLNGGAPQAIIRKPGGIRFVFSTENARKSTDPSEFMEFWDGFQQYHADLAGGPPTGAADNIWLFDRQVGYGYANAIRPRINFPIQNEPFVLGAATWSEDEPRPDGAPWWVFGHELGHLWQTDDWGHGPTYGEIGEVAVNLFTMYTMNFYIFEGSDSTIIGRNITAFDEAAAAKELSWPTAGVWGRLALYRQLIFEFGWDSIKQVFHSYFNPQYPRSSYGSQLEGFAIRFSAIVERDMVRFFQGWEYPLSESAITRIRSFGHEEWLPSGW